MPQMDMTENWDHPFPHILRAQVEDAHIDLMRHTNNVVYLQWLEDVAWAHSLALGLGPEQYEFCGHGLVVRQHELTYLAATRQGRQAVAAPAFPVCAGPRWRDRVARENALCLRGHRRRAGAAHARVVLGHL
jgi:hypothetical protein